MSDDSAPSRPWETLPKWPRRAVSVWLVFHLTAIVSAPASVAPASELARAMWSICRPYLQTLYLNHGYHFFAPNPGESTLLAWTVENADGTTLDDAIPHPRLRPRLLYHRHFMLTESLASVAAVSDQMLAADEVRGSKRIRDDSPESRSGGDVAPVATESRTDVEFAELDVIEVDDPPPLQGLLRDWYESYARCILARSGGERVHMSRVMHYLPEIEWMQESIARGEPLTLNEPQSFTEFPIGVFDRDGLVVPRQDEQKTNEPDESDETVPDRADLALTPAPAGGQP